MFLLPYFVFLQKHASLLFMTLVVWSVGTAFPCCLCKVSAVPQYHLAMVDGTIRNFCSYDCVCTYRVTAPIARQPSDCRVLICQLKPRRPVVLNTAVISLTEVRDRLSVGPHQWSLHPQGRRQTSELSPSRPSGPPIFSPLPGPPSQSYLSAPTGASLPSHLLPLCPRESQTTCW